MTDLPELPDFLRISQAQRNAAWRGRKVRSMRTMAEPKKVKDVDPQTRAFMRELEKQKEAKKRESLAKLAEWKAEQKRLGIKPRRARKVVR